MPELKKMLFAPFLYRKFSDVYKHYKGSEKFNTKDRNVKVKDTYSLHMAPDSPLNAYSKEILTHVKDYKWTSFICYCNTFHSEAGNKVNIHQQEKYENH